MNVKGFWGKQVRGELHLDRLGQRVDAHHCRLEVDARTVAADGFVHHRPGIDLALRDQQA